MDLLDDENVNAARLMATVYTAIAAFEDTVRQFIVKVLLEHKGGNWWEECVSEKIRKNAESRKREEEKIRWHTPRGDSMINYTEFGDLASIMMVATITFYIKNIKVTSYLSDSTWSACRQGTGSALPAAPLTARRPGAF